jgi:hypothetical protein
MTETKMYSFIFSFKNIVENMGGRFFANHSFTISTLAAFAATIAVAVVGGDLRGHGHGLGGLHYRLRRH